MEEPASPVVANSSTKPAEVQTNKIDAGEASVTPVASGEDVDSPLKSIMPDASSSKQVSSRFRLPSLAEW